MVKRCDDETSSPAVLSPGDVGTDGNATSLPSRKRDDDLRCFTSSVGQQQENKRRIVEDGALRARGRRRHRDSAQTATHTGPDFNQRKFATDTFRRGNRKRFSARFSRRAPPEWKIGFFWRPEHLLMALIALEIGTNRQTAAKAFSRASTRRHRCPWSSTENACSGGAAAAGYQRESG